MYNSKSFISFTAIVVCLTSMATVSPTFAVDTHKTLLEQFVTAETAFDSLKASLDVLKGTRDARKAELPDLEAALGVPTKALHQHLFDLQEHAERDKFEQVLDFDCDSYGLTKVEVTPEADGAAATYSYTVADDAEPINAEAMINARSTYVGKFDALEDPADTYQSASDKETEFTAKAKDADGWLNAIVDKFFEIDAGQRAKLETIASILGEETVSFNLATINSENDLEQEEQWQLLQALVQNKDMLEEDELAQTINPPVADGVTLESVIIDSNWADLLDLIKTYKEHREIATAVAPVVKANDETAFTDAKNKVAANKVDAARELIKAFGDLEDATLGELGISGDEATTLRKFKVKIVDEDAADERPVYDTPQEGELSPSDYTKENVVSLAARVKGNYVTEIATRKEVITSLERILPAAKLDDLATAQKAVNDKNGQIKTAGDKFDTAKAADSPYLQAANALFDTSKTLSYAMNEVALVHNVWNQIPTGSSTKDGAAGLSFTFNHLSGDYNALLYSGQAEGHYRYQMFDVGLAFNYGFAESEVKHAANGTVAKIRNHLFSGIVNLAYYDVAGFQGGVNFGGGANLTFTEGINKRYIGFAGANFGYNFDLSTLLDLDDLELTIMPEAKADLAYASSFKADDKKLQKFFAKFSGGFKLTVSQAVLSDNLSVSVQIPAYGAVGWEIERGDGIKITKDNLIYYAQTGLDINFGYNDLLTATVGYKFEWNPTFITHGASAKVHFNF